jgi:hypothetical protein
VTDGEINPLQSSDPLRALRADRDLLAAAMQVAEPKELAGLSREYRAVLAELERRGVGREESVTDDLAARRANRRAAGKQKPTGT